MKHRKKFIEIAPEMKTYKCEQPFFASELIALVVALALNRCPPTPHADKKTAYTELKNHVGLEFVHAVVLKLAATLGLLCRSVADGRNKRAACAYLNYRVYEAASNTGVFGRDLLDLVTQTVQLDIDFYADHKLPRV
jgi:hypothetical protein